MLFLKFVGWISAIFGVMLLFMPKALIRINNVVNRILLDLDSALYKMRIGIGISLCLVSLMTFFVVYYISQKFGIK